MAGSAFAEEYLALLRSDPGLTRQGIADRMGVKLSAIEHRLRFRADLREEEQKIRAAHAAQEALRKVQAGEAPPEDAPGLEEDIPLHLLRFLEIYAETDDRIETVKRMREEGFDVRWADVAAAMGQYPGFAAAMGELWDEGGIEAEDQLRKNARAGSRWAVKAYLAANMAGKYGPRLKVEVGVTHRLEPAHREMVEGIKKQFLAPPRLKSYVEDSDVVEGEVVLG